MALSDSLTSQLHRVLGSDSAPLLIDAMARRDSELVLELACPVMDGVGGGECEFVHRVSAYIAAHELLERLFLAALDCARQNDAMEYLSRLEDAYPASNRVRRLRGMALEARGDWEGALDVYAAVLRDDPGNQGALKRQVAAILGQGRVEDAIEALNRYLTVYHGDTGAWQTLATLYLSLDQLPRAAFCLEELIVADPDCPHHATRYAEVLATQGDGETARLFFGRAVELGGGLRAAMGGAMCGGPPMSSVYSVAT